MVKAAVKVAWSEMFITGSEETDMRAEAVCRRSDIMMLPGSYMPSPVATELVRSHYAMLRYVCMSVRPSVHLSLCPVPPLQNDAF